MSNEVMEKTSPQLKSSYSAAQSRGSADCPASSKPAMANRLLDWFSVVMADSKHHRQHPKPRGTKIFPPVHNVLAYMYFLSPVFPNSVLAAPSTNKSLLICVTERPQLEWGRHPCVSARARDRRNEKSSFIVFCRACLLYISLSARTFPPFVFVWGFFCAVALIRLHGSKCSGNSSEHIGNSFFLAFTHVVL